MVTDFIESIKDLQLKITYYTRQDFLQHEIQVFFHSFVFTLKIMSEQ